VAVVPFQAFDMHEQTGWFRMSVGAVSMADIEGALERLGALLQRYAERQAEQVLQLGKPNLDREQQLAATLRLAHASSSRTSHFGLGTPSLADMVDAGVEVLHEPFLLDRCQKGIDNTLRKIRTGKLLVGDASVVVKGMPDFTGDLAEGEIMLIIDGKHSQPLALRGIDNDTASGGGGQRGASTSTPALVYRPPGVRASDVRKVKSVYSQRLVDELFGDANAIDSSRASAVFFSIHGAQPLGDMLAGGDYDGDEYYIFQERELIDLFEGGACVEGAELGTTPNSAASNIAAKSSGCSTGIDQASAPALPRLGLSSAGVVSTSSKLGVWPLGNVIVTLAGQTPESSAS
jgi:hypothetical protein